MKKFKLVSLVLAITMLVSVVGVFIPQSTNVVQAAMGIVTTYPGPTGIPASDQYSVKVNSQDSFVYKSVTQRTDGAGGNSFSFTDFSFTGGTATVEVTKLTSGSINSVVVRPLNLGISATINGNTISFTISDPCKVSVEINGDLTNKMFIFADPPEVNVPSPTDPNVIYFGPGVYDVGSDYFIPAGKTMYIAGGAYVKGKVFTTGQDNIAIRGRGIFSGENFPHVDGPGNFSFIDCNNVKMEGIISLNSPGFNINNGYHINPGTTYQNNFTNLKLLGWQDNTDGIHTQGKSVIDGLFFFGHDDAIDIGQFITDLRVTNCTTWNIWGSVLLFSWISNYGSNVYVDNINAIHFDAPSGKSPVFLMVHGGSANLNNFTIQNVRVESMGGGNKSFIGLKMAKSQWSDPSAPYGSLDNVYFKNIEINSPTSNNYIYGYDSTHKISNILFENLKINGQVCTSPADAVLSLNQYTQNIDFISKNYISNGSFVSNDGSSGSLNNWSIWPGNSGNDGNAVSIGNQGAYLGNYYLNHWKNQAYEVYSYQTSTNLPNGTYNLTAWVKSSGGQSHAFMEAKDFGGTAKTTNIPTTETWTKITIPGVNVTNGKCTVGFYSNASAGQWIQVDNVILSKEQPINLLTNSSFEANGATQTPTGWWEALTPTASFTETVNGAHTGNYHGTHWSSTAYQTYTAQTVTGLTNGTYTATSWVRSSGGQAGCFMEAKDFGGTAISVNIPSSPSTWTKITIPNINVTNGQCTVGFYSGASANQWLHFDDVELVKN